MPPSVDRAVRGMTTNYQISSALSIISDVPFFVRRTEDHLAAFSAPDAAVQWRLQGNPGYISAGTEIMLLEACRNRNGDGSRLPSPMYEA